MRNDAFLVLQFYFLLQQERSGNGYERQSNLLTLIRKLHRCTTAKNVICYHTLYYLILSPFPSDDFATRCFNSNEIVWEESRHRDNWKVWIRLSLARNLSTHRKISFHHQSRTVPSCCAPCIHSHHNRALPEKFQMWKMSWRNLREMQLHIKRENFFGRH